MRDNDKSIFTLVLDQPTSVNIRSAGYAGDPYSDLGIITGGGFDTYLTLFDSTGAFVAENDDGETANVDPTTGQGFDAQIQQDLSPGTYSVWLTQYGNYALGSNDSSGFSQDEHPYYTNDISFTAGLTCPSGVFQDTSGSEGACRNGNYSLEFLDLQGAYAYYSLLGSPPLSSAPEPATYWTAISALGVIVLVTWRNR